MAINFPNAPINGNTYDFGGVRYTYTKSGVDEGYWRVTTPGSVGIATSNEISAGTDGIKYVTPLGLAGTVEWDLLVDATAAAVADTLAVRTATGNLLSALATSAGQVVTYEQLLGVGQTYSDVGASRAAGTTYTNTSDKPILIIIKGTNGSFIEVAVDGLTMPVADTNTANAYPTASVVIPPGSTYSCSFAFTEWFELS